MKSFFVSIGKYLYLVLYLVVSPSLLANKMDLTPLMEQTDKIKSEIQINDLQQELIYWPKLNRAIGIKLTFDVSFGPSYNVDSFNNLDMINALYYSTTHDLRSPIIIQVPIINSFYMESLSLAANSLIQSSKSKLSQIEAINKIVQQLSLVDNRVIQSSESKLSQIEIINKSIKNNIANNSISFSFELYPQYLKSISNDYRMFCVVPSAPDIIFTLHKTLERIGYPKSLHYAFLIPINTNYGMNTFINISDLLQQELAKGPIFGGEDPLFKNIWSTLADFSSVTSTEFHSCGSPTETEC